jgi:restriction system protein
MNGKPKKKLAKGPQFTRFFGPIIEVLRESGGSSTSSEVTDGVIERLGITAEEQAIILKSGQSRVYNQVHWARMYLVHGGIVDSSRRGIWTLTEKGKQTDLDKFDSAAFFKSVYRRGKKLPDDGQPGPVKDRVTDQQASELEESKPDDLLAVLRTLPPAGFERLCERLLREHGFQKVTVTGKSGDGGIDGIGILQVNKFVSFTVLFQCKRYQGAVTPSQVRDFRGAMEGRADKGIMITTGVFTVEAKKEARRDGAKAIELVDGQSLVELFQSLELGLSPRTTYDIDEKFFDEFRQTQS